MMCIYNVIIKPFLNRRRYHRIRPPGSARPDIPPPPPAGADRGAVARRAAGVRDAAHAAAPRHRAAAAVPGVAARHLHGRRQDAAGQGEPRRRAHLLFLAGLYSLCISVKRLSMSALLGK